MSGLHLCADVQFMAPARSAQDLPHGARSPVVWHVANCGRAGNWELGSCDITWPGPIFFSGGRDRCLANFALDEIEVQ